MVWRGPLAVIAQSIRARSLLLLAAACIAGCADYDVGPDPSPWSPPAEAAAQGTVK